MFIVPKLVSISFCSLWFFLFFH